MITGADIVFLDSCNHIVVANLVGGGSLQLCAEQVHQLQNTGLGSGGGLGCDQIVAAVSAGADSLGAVLVQALDLGGIQGVGAGVHGIQIDVVVNSTSSMVRG